MLVWSWHPPRFRLGPLFSCACVFQYLACKAHDVSQHLLSSSKVNTDRGSNWAGKQRLYSGVVMCISLALPTDADIHLFILRASFSAQAEWAAGHSITPHVGENSWKAHAHTHLLDLDWCDRDGSLWLVIRGNHQSSDSPCTQKCVRWKRMLCVRKKGMRFACLRESLCNGCCVQNARGNYIFEWPISPYSSILCIHLNVFWHLTITH